VATPDRSLHLPRRPGRCQHSGLLLDLTEPGGPNSTALFLAEGGHDLTGGLCADVDWSDDALLDATVGVHGTGRAQV